MPPVSSPDEALWALVPVKSLARAKQRLEPRLGRDRSGLAKAMLGDVLAALAGSSRVSRTAVVTADPVAAGVAGSTAALVVDEKTPMGMNQALELGIEAISRAGARRILIVPSDMPLLTGAELDRLIADLQDPSRARPVTGIGPSGDRGGTNFLYFDARRPLPMLFGPNSFRRHRSAAIERGEGPVTIESPCIALDIDEGQDLDDFIAFAQSDPEFQGTRTWKFLKDHGYARQAGRNTMADINDRPDSLQH